MIPRSCMAVLACSSGTVRRCVDPLAWSAGRPVASPADDGVELAAVEAGPGSGVAGCAHLVHPNQQGIAVAVHGKGLDPLDVSGGVALAPVLLPGAGVERHPAVVMVRCSASSSIQPSISTSWVSNCWTIAATRPGAVALQGLRQAGSGSGLRERGCRWRDSTGGGVRHWWRAGDGAGCSDISSSLVPPGGAATAPAALTTRCCCRRHQKRRRFPCPPPSRASFTSDAFRRSVPRSPGRNPAGSRP